MGGFRTGRSTIDQIFVVKRMAEKFREYGVDLHHLFIDFRTAYDSINRSMLYRILAELGTHPKIIRLIKMTMSESIGQVKIFGGITDPFPINTGLKQGDGLAPILFNMALHWAVNKTQVDLQNTLLYKSIQIVGYADDLNIMARTRNVIEDTYKELEQATAKMGLQVNREKTKYMVQKRDRNKNLVQGSRNAFEEVEKFKYLGVMITRDNDETIEIQGRITAANKAYYALIGIMKSNHVHQKTKIKIYQTIIRSVLTYGSETWTMSKKIETMLGVFERKVLRRIFGAVLDNQVWRIRYNQELYEKYKSMDLVTFIKLRRLEWAGHVYRMEECRIPRRVMEGRLYGVRPIGRPRNRWTDAVTVDAKKFIGSVAWRRRSMDREEWKRKIKEAKARLWAVTPL